MTLPNSSLVAANAFTRVVFGFPVAHDVMWSASTRRRFASILKLESQPWDMLQATGCEDWVFHSIAEVSLLRIWKRERQASQALNIAELARRATKLEQEIDSQAQESIRNNKPDMTATEIDVTTCSSITRVYVAATKTYLHVVLSGASPEVSDIQDAVDAAVDALKTLTSAVLIRRLAWPICVAACLAESRHDTFLDRLE